MISNKKILFIIDLQKETLRKLHKSVFQNTLALLENKELYKIGDVVATRFINTQDNLFYKELNYSGCMCNNVDSNIPQEILEHADYIIDKTAYGINDDILLSLFKQIISPETLPKEVYIAGTDIDACVYAVALELWDLGIVPKIILPCTGTTSNIPNTYKTCVQLLSRQIGKHNLIHSLDALKNVT